jgi:hypothetical protein
MRLFMLQKNILPVVLMWFLSAAFPLSALDLPLGQIPDDSALRARLKDSWFTESPDRVLARSPALHTLDSGARIELRGEAGAEEFMVILARELTNGKTGAASGSFPGWAQGSWILTRRKDTGAISRIRVFLRSDPYTYVQFRPFIEGKSFMDVVLYDAYISRSLPIAVSLERLCVMPLTETLRLAGDQFPRKYFEPESKDYQEQRLFIRTVRERLTGLEFADDGAIDENGRYVYIDGGAAQTGKPGLNCSGFAKWLVDGILRPVTGERLAIPPLKAPFGKRGSSFTDVWESLRDPFFGLDWIRNLASTAGSTLRSPAYASLDEIEVRSDLFSQVIIRDKSGAAIRPYPGFLENAGYGIEGLHPLLYTLAIDEPGRFYLAAVNTETGPPATEANPRGRPRMRQYFHIAALVPYFNEYGVFQVAVFESAAETSFSAFKSRYPGHYVNLVRLPLETRFDP